MRIIDDLPLDKVESVLEGFPEKAFLFDAAGDGAFFSAVVAF